MRKLQITNTVTRAFGKASLKVQKHSPEILLVAGIAGVVTSAVMACKATTKANDIVEEAKEGLDEIHAVVEIAAEVQKRIEAGEKDLKPIEYTLNDQKKDTAIVYVQTGLKYAKLYGPSVLLGMASIGCILASHNIIHKRNVGLAAAYSAVDRGFKEYRQRVVERFGEELDRELKYNLKAKEVEETVTDDKTGENKVVKKTVHTISPNHYSPYAIIFDEYCKGWEKDAELNKYFLIQVQNWANEKLQSRGHIFLNEVLEELGLDHTSMGAQVGWTMYGTGDGYVDFGIFDIHNEKACDFVNGRERSIVLDFNVDGYILDAI